MFTDVILAFSTYNIIFWGTESLFKPLQGFPLAFASVASAWYLNLLPSQTYISSIPEYTKIVNLSITLDFFQYVSHILAHNIWKHSHAIHHTKTSPTYKDAFFTGYIDAFCQLLIPLYISIWLIKPNKITITIFGILYSHWLRIIHSDRKIDTGPLFIDPEYHVIHHKNPTKNLGHIYIIWDLIFDTIDINSLNSKIYNFLQLKSFIQGIHHE